MTLLNIIIILVVSVVMSALVEKFNLSRRNFGDCVKLSFIINYSLVYLASVIPVEFIAIGALTILYILSIFYIIFNYRG